MKIKRIIRLVDFPDRDPVLRLAYEDYLHELRRMDLYSRDYSFYKYLLNRGDPELLDLFREHEQKCREAKALWE